MDESITKHLDQPTKQLRLSEAIRIGAKLGPQFRGTLFFRGSSCAMGAALLGRGASPSIASKKKDLHEVAPELFNKRGTYTRLAREICEMNDKFRLSRESIADWLESKGY